MILVHCAPSYFDLSWCVVGTFDEQTSTSVGLTYIRTSRTYVHTPRDIYERRISSATFCRCISSVTFTSRWALREIWLRVSKLKNGSH